MADIVHDVWFRATAAQVYAGVSSPAGLDRWWTRRSSGAPAVGETYELFFDTGYDWRASVVRAVSDVAFELELTDAMPDWRGTHVSFDIEPQESGVRLHFAHRGWPDDGEHFRTSSYCWAMYLRILRRNIEHGETVPYNLRLAV